MIGVLVIGFGYSFYDSFIKKDVRDALIQRCQAGVARSELDQRFALEAAKARRRNAETLEEQGEKIKAANELATAKVYEDIADGYKRLTVKDCEDTYGN